ncbi:NrtR-regulated NrtX [Oleiphilus sp. HI0071]|uniref:SPFH domain-containing protein n=1 Tax=Oleiphilus sp. HI0080 TaxID=1822255 RepID=UPI0007C2A1E0|nr:SPFH domain-containing protein [Oleiphilus sp. HI0080]KZY60164.1 NrtR-regulated NrtX [Oleiphilus sp. HI0065]KZY78485.1 NrtR-regulated NrtX [Oleiphilus sp. HI0071]KZY88789.1 NrtR-regulated NrtX [Oleiphilus sp. HI0073]KZZ49650.1 NrtR-regulated NrtX [Oleiphilus sp. HI0122]KZY90133.1 NrtR-regulated NrtX [Oleiphilus sp. HI0073]
MFTIKYYKSDASTFVIKTVNGKSKAKGKGLSFFYNAATTSIAALPVNVQEAPFIFNLQTADFQQVSVQGQVSFRLADAEKTAELMNFTLAQDAVSFVSEDPMRLNERVLRVIQVAVQAAIQSSNLRQALGAAESLVSTLDQVLAAAPSLQALGIEVLGVSISNIAPTPETARALEAVAREEILKQSDDAIYGRRKASVEQERTIKEAELETELSVQSKQQEMEERHLENERTLLSQQAKMDQERMQAEIAQEEQRSQFVETKAANSRIEADADKYRISSRMNAFKVLPVENLKAMALANMDPEQLMAMAFESLAQNAGKINELTITPDLFSKMVKANG